MSTAVLLFTISCNEPCSCDDHCRIKAARYPGGIAHHVFYRPANVKAVAAPIGGLTKYRRRTSRRILPTVTAPIGSITGFYFLWYHNQNQLSLHLLVALPPALLCFFIAHFALARMIHTLCPFQRYHSLRPEV